MTGWSGRASGLRRWLGRARGAAAWLERPWLLRLAIASTFASAVFFYLRAFHTASGVDMDVVRAVLAGPAIGGLVWTLHRVLSADAVARASFIAPRRLGLAVVAVLLAWISIWATAQAMVALVAPGAAPVLDGAGYAAAALVSGMGLNALVARARRPAGLYSAA